MIAGTLEIQLLANLARISSDMDKVQSTVSGAMKNVEASVNMAKAALGALGVTLSVGYFIHLIEGSIDALDHLNALSKTGRLTIETLSGLKLAAKQSGSDLDSISDAVNKLAVNMGKHPEKFKAIGVAAKDPIEAFKQFADFTNKLGNEQLRAGVLAEGLGKKWQGAAPLLAQGSEKIQQMIDRGKALSGVTKEMAEEADHLKAEIAALTTAFDRNKTKLAVSLLPALNDIVQAMNEAAKDGSGLTTILVGVGGTIMWLFGLTPAQTLKREIAELEEHIKRLKEAADRAPTSLLGRSAAANLPGLEAKLAGMKDQTPEAEAERARKAMEVAQKAARESAATAAAQEKAQRDAEAQAAAFLELNKQRDESFQQIMKSMKVMREEQERELAGSVKLSEGEKKEIEITAQLNDGKIKYTKAQKEQALAEAANLAQNGKTLAAREREKALYKELADQAEKRIQQEERLDEVVNGARSRDEQQMKDLAMELDFAKKEAVLNGAALMTDKQRIELTSRLNEEREKAVANKQIDLDLERDLLAVGEESSDENNKRIDEIYKLAAARKEAVNQAISDREAVKLSNDLRRSEASQFATMWGKVEDLGKQAFVAVFSHGKDAMQSLGQAIKASVIDLLYELTVHKWIINIGASLSGSFASGASSAAGGSLFGGGFNPMNLFSGNSGGFSLDSIGSALGFGAGGSPGVIALAGEEAALTGSGVAVGGALGTGATAGLGAAVPYVGAALLAASALGLFGDDNEEPPPGFRRPNWLKLISNGAGGFGFESSELPDPDVMAALIPGLTASLNDPTKFDPDVLKALIGTQVQVDAGKGTNDLLKAMNDALQSAAIDMGKLLQTQQQARDTLAQLKDAAGINALTAYRDSLAVSEFVAPMARLSAAQAQYEAVKALALSGDQNAIKQFPGVAQGLLGIGRDVFASGSGFQGLFKDVNSTLQDVLDMQNSLFADIPAAIQQTGADQVKALKDQIKVMSEGFTKVTDQLAKINLKLAANG